MEKVLVANVSSGLIDEIRKGNHSLEFELIELNKHLSEGWSIKSYDIVSNQTTSAFSIIYRLTK